MDRILPGAKHPMNQDTPAMQMVMWLQSLHNHYLNLKAGIIDSQTMLKHLEEHLKESKVLSKYLVNNKWPET